MRRRTFPRLMIGFLLLSLAALGAELLLLASISGVESNVRSEAGANVVRMALSALIWVPYFLVSKRVKATFVA